jgi:uncharacterized membrane protein
MLGKFFKKTDEGTPINGTEINPNLNANTRDKEESYEHWGTRWSGQTNAAPQGLNSSLQAVYFQIKKEQAANYDLQQKMKDDLQKEIEQIKQNICTEDGNKQIEEDKLETCKEKIIEKKKEKQNIINGKISKINRDAKVNFIIGLVIVILITCYLFLFYSSTAFAAFFKEDNVLNSSVSAAMFDGQAWVNAWHTGFGEFLFVLLLPVLFMGLGFVVYQFNKGTQGKERYIKTFSLYGLTFIFDCLLAYFISRNIYNSLNAGSLDTIEYNLSMAFQSPDFWIVIFCGFVAYIIWGLVFSFTMHSFDQLDNQKFEIERIENELDSLKRDEGIIKGKIVALENKIRTMKSRIEEAEKQINSYTRYDYNAIKHELANFFNGWLGFMNLIHKNNNELNDAQKTYNDFISKVDAQFVKPNNINNNISADNNNSK